MISMISPASRIGSELRFPVRHANFGDQPGQRPRSIETPNRAGQSGNPLLMPCPTAAFADVNAATLHGAGLKPTVPTACAGRARRRAPDGSAPPADNPAY